MESVVDSAKAHGLDLHFLDGQRRQPAEEWSERFCGFQDDHAWGCSGCDMARLGNRGSVLHDAHSIGERRRNPSKGPRETGADPVAPP